MEIPGKPAEVLYSMSLTVHFHRSNKNDESNEYRFSTVQCSVYACTYKTYKLKCCLFVTFTHSSSIDLMKLAIVMDAGPSI